MAPRKHKLRSGEAHFSRATSADAATHAFGGAIDRSQWTPLANVSIDIGTVNMAITKQTLYVRAGAAPDGKGSEADWVVHLEHATTLDLKGPQRDGRIEHMVGSLFALMNDPDNAWIWEDPATEIVVERQMDHLQEARGRTRYKPPVMFALYATIQTIVLARQAAPLLVDWDAAGMGDDAILDTCAKTTKDYAFVPASGIQKTGLEADHGNARKQNTADVALAYFASENQRAAGDFQESLLRPKPAEDVADAYLQGRRKLEDQHRERLKTHRVKLRAARAATNRLAKAAKKRKRTITGAEKEAPAKKRPRTEKAEVISVSE